MRWDRDLLTYRTPAAGCLVGLVHFQAGNNGVLITNLRILRRNSTMQYVSENIGGEKNGNSNKILAHIWSALPHMMENECGTLGGSNMEGSLTLKLIKTGLKLAIFPVHNISAACHVGTSLQSPAIFTCWLTFMAYRGTLMRFSHNNISYTCAFPAMTNQNPCLINSSQAGLSNRNMCGSWHIRTVKSLLFLLVHHGYWWQTQTRARTVRFFLLRMK